MHFLWRFAPLALLDQPTLVDVSSQDVSLVPPLDETQCKTKESLGIIFPQLV